MAAGSGVHILLKGWLQAGLQASIPRVELRGRGM